MGRARSTTLVELVIAVILVSVIVMAIVSIDLFSRFQIIASERRAVLHNQVSFALEHMSKNFLSAIGDINQPAVNIANISGDTGVRIWIDANKNGRRDAADYEIAYRFTGASGAVGNRYQIWYYASCAGPNCNQAGSSTPEVIASNILSFLPTTSGGNYLNIAITARWLPAQAKSTDNPEVAMSASLQMPSVSTN